MKNILLSLLLLSGLSGLAKENDLPVACPKGSVSAIVTAGYPNIVQHLGGSLVSLGPFSAAVDYQLSMRLGLGFQYTYRFSGSGLKSFSSPTNGVIQYENKEGFHSFMATADYYYRNRGRVCFSSGIAFGYTLKPILSLYASQGLSDPEFIRSTQRETGFLAFRLRLLHVKYSVTKSFGINGGVGVGIDGFITAGLHYTFSGRE